jgi:hypothetical protein
MTYTAENITNIKLAGNLENYIETERKLIDRLENAEVLFDEQGKNTISYGHLYGRIGINMETAAPEVVASMSYSDWAKSWKLSGFDNDQSRAMAYASAALKNTLVEDGKKILSEARSRLATLQAAQ